MMSTRNIAGRLNVDHQTAWRVLHDQQLHPCHPQKIQVMQPQDFTSRAHFCKWFMHRCVEEPDLPWRILFTDEISSPGKLFSIHATVICGLIKICMLHTSRVSEMIQSEHLGFFLQISRVPHTLAIPWRHTAWALGRYATDCASKHVVSAWWPKTSFFTSGPWYLVIFI